MPGTTTANAINAGIPEARFQCEGAAGGLGVAGGLPVNRMDAFHFRDNTGGYRPPLELYYAELVEQGTQWNGFFCQRCLESFGKKPGKRPSLLTIIEERIEQNQREANDKLTRALRIK